MAALREQGDSLKLSDGGLVLNKAWIAYDAREGARNIIRQLVNKVVDEYAAGFSGRAGEIPREVGRSTVDLLLLAIKATAGVYVPVFFGASMAQVLLFYQQNPWLIMFIAGGDKWLQTALEYIGKKQSGG